MTKIFTLLLLFLVSVVKAQTQPFGVVDTSDLKLTSCNFEKDANAMVLFDICTIHYTFGSIWAEYHKRLKIFNSHANALGDVSVELENDLGSDWEKSLEAQTINLDGGKIRIIPLDKKNIYIQKVNKWVSRYTFSFPAIKSGSIVEYSFSKKLPYVLRIPDWYFQGKLPIRYSQVKIIVPQGFILKHYLRANQDMPKNTDTLLAMTNIHSLPREPFMDSYNDNLQRASFILVPEESGTIKPVMSLTWQDLGADLMFKRSYGQQLKVKLRGEEKLLEQVKGVSPEEKIAFIFKSVKDGVICYGDDAIYPEQTINGAWLRKKGNSAEINMILCRLLTQAGVVTCPLIVSTSAEKRIDPREVRMANFDKTVAYATVNDRNYVLDASGKDNVWYQTPIYVLNTYGLYMNVEKSSTGLIFIQNDTLAKDIVFVNAEITADGKMEGAAQISSNGFNKEFKRLLYEKLGEVKYKEFLTENNNDLKVDSIRLQNKENDTIPLIQNIKFKLTLPASDENYIYFDPNLFTLLKQNPLLNETRYSSVDFTYRKYYSINGRYKIPIGYELTGIPKNIDLVMPDKSISFKRNSAGDDGYVSIHYVIKFEKSFFTKDEYPALHEFFKKMYEMLNEQIVLKKGS